MTDTPETGPSPTDLENIRHEGLRVSGLTLRDVLAENVDGNDLAVRNSVLRDLGMRNVSIRGAWLHGVDISGEVDGLTVNGVEVGPLVEAELRRRHPDYAAMRPEDAAGFRHAWHVVEELWAGTVDRARTLAPDALHEQVDGEWSFTETLRHLVFATESWVGRTLLGDPSPWHALSLPWDGMPDTAGVPRDREVRPDLETVLALRADRQAVVRRVVEGLTDADLDRVVATPEGPGWPPAGETFPLREPLLVVLNEEWWHRRFAERDLDALERSG